MSTLNDLHGKVPPPPVHVVALGFNGPWEVQTMKVRLATCRDRNVADYIAALWNLMPSIEEIPIAKAALSEAVQDTMDAEAQNIMRNFTPAKRPYRRAKAGKSVQVMP